MQGRLIQNRNRKLDAAEMQTARAMLAAILQTKVPGLGADVPLKEAS